MNLQPGGRVSRFYAMPRHAAVPRASVTPRSTLLVQLAFVLFVALLFEGILRKWVFPQQHQYFYFLRDPLLLGFYFAAARRRAVRLNGWFGLWLGAAIVISLISLLVYLLNDLPATLWILGVRNYFMYMPLAFIVGQTFRLQDLERLAKLVALLAIPMAFICVEQYLSPPGGWLNVGAGGQPPPTFADDLLRTTGLFASDAQHATYVVFSLSLLAAVILGVRHSRKDRYILIAGSVATFVMLIVSGSRGAWFQAAGTGLAAFSSFFLMRSNFSDRLRGILVPLAAVLLVAALFSTLLAGAYKAYEQRNLQAQTFSSSTTDRIASMFFPNSMFDASVGGQGIGLGTTGAAALLTGTRALTLAEGDLDRNFIELGLFGGWIFVALRISFSVWLVWISLRAARQGNMMALLLASFSALAIFQSQITMHTAYSHLAWFAVGLTIAAARFALAPPGAGDIGNQSGFTPAHAGRSAAPRAKSGRL